MKEINLTSEQISAIKRSVDLGRILQDEHPEALNLYRGGKTLEEITHQLNLREKYSVSKRVAISSLSYALRGYRGTEEPVEYKGLTCEEELNQLEGEHKINGLNKGRSKSYETRKKNNLGIFSLSPDELSTNGRKGGKKGGKIVVEKRLGAHALTHEEHQEAGRKSVISQGKKPFLERIETEAFVQLGELEYAYRLSRSPFYQYSKGGSGSCKGKPNWSLITGTINRIYHNGEEVRTPTTISVCVNKKIREQGFV